MAVFAFALFVGVFLSPQRRAFSSPWIWLGGGVALILFLPNLIWNSVHGWPFLEFMRNVRASGHNVVLGPLEYVAHQVLIVNPASAPVWVAGVWWLRFSARGRDYLAFFSTSANPPAASRPIASWSRKSKQIENALRVAILAQGCVTSGKCRRLSLHRGRIRSPWLPR